MIESTLIPLVRAFFDLSILYYLSINLLYGVLLVAAVLSIRRQLRSRPLIESLRERFSFVSPPISILAPAYNEEATIAHSIRSFLMLNYPAYEVVVINDGSKDRTLEILKEAFFLERAELPYESERSTAEIRGTYRSKVHPNLVVIDKANGGKADALNVGIGFSQYEHFCAVDADSILEDDALIRIAMPFIEAPDRTIATGGTIRVANGSRIKHGRVVEPRLPSSFLPLCQVIEYTRAFLCGRIGWNVFNATMVISGAFGLFSKKAATAAGGYRKGSLGEDMELIVRMHRHHRERKIPYSIVFIPDPVCWTEVPSDWGTLYRQRSRWQRGLAETVLGNSDMIFRPAYGVLAWLALPYFLVVELFGPLIEVLSLTALALAAALGILDWRMVSLFFQAGVLYGILMTVAALLVGELYFSKYPKVRQFLGLLAVGAFESFGYRQVNSAWRLMGLVSYLRGNRSWGKMKRSGFAG